MRLYSLSLSLTSPGCLSCTYRYLGRDRWPCQAFDFPRLGLLGANSKSRHLDCRLAQQITARSRRRPPPRSSGTSAAVSTWGSSRSDDGPDDYSAGPS